MTQQNAAHIAIERLLGRPATEAELAIYAAQEANLEAGIFDNPLIPRVVHSTDPGLMPHLRTSLVTIPFVPNYRTVR